MEIVNNLDTFGQKKYECPKFYAYNYLNTSKLNYHLDKWTI